MTKDVNPLPRKKSEGLPEEKLDAFSILSLGDPELEARFISIQKAHDDLDIRIDEVLAQMNFNRKSLSEYLNNPKNFSSGDWESLQNRRRENEQKIMNMFGITGRKIIEAKQKDKSSKERKGKTLGARKNWMPMR